MPCLVARRRRRARRFFCGGELLRPERSANYFILRPRGLGSGAAEQRLRHDLVVLPAHLLLPPHGAVRGHVLRARWERCVFGIGLDLRRLLSGSGGSRRRSAIRVVLTLNCRDSSCDRAAAFCCFNALTIAWHAGKIASKSSEPLPGSCRTRLQIQQIRRPAKSCGLVLSIVVTLQRRSDLSCSPRSC
jgi:hypothetical protein